MFGAYPRGGIGAASAVSWADEPVIARSVLRAHPVRTLSAARPTSAKTACFAWYGACPIVEVMTWKRCTGCTRAIAATAFTCEYCGQVCDDVMDFLPLEDGNAVEPAGEDHGDRDRGVENALDAFGAREPWHDEPQPLESKDQPPPDAPVVARYASEYTNSNDHDSAETAMAPLAALDIAFDAAAAPASNSPFVHALDSSRPTESAAPSAVKERPAKPAAQRMTPRQLAIAGGGVMAAGILMFTILGSRGAASPESATVPAPGRKAAPATAPARPKPVSAVAPRASEPAPHWSRVTDGRWVGTSRHSAAFEVSATDPIHVWMRDVTPVLVVRCEAGRTEAFVYTQSAAQMEPQDGDHTVSLAFDDGSATNQRWPDSAEHDALFARNGGDFTRQLAGARTFRFGFTPHNAGPATATFAVDGLEEMMASAGKTCRQPVGR